MAGKKTKFVVNLTVENFGTFDEAKAAVVAAAKIMREHVDPSHKIWYEINDSEEIWSNTETGVVLADGLLASHRQKRFVLSIAHASAVDDDVFEYTNDFDTHDEAMAAALARRKEMSERGIVHLHAIA